MLRVDKVSVKFGQTTALSQVSLSLPAAQSLIVVGESGAGKSSLLAAILGLLQPSSGRITWQGQLIKRACRPALVMQEPRAAFNPMLSLRRSVLEPLLGSGQGLGDADAKIKHLCARLELAPEILERYPQQVSIGQAQRVGILRALIAAPPLVLLDEPLSALDAVSQKLTAKLIAELQREQGFAALAVTHDLGYATAYADTIVVLKSGCIEEITTPQSFVRAPQSSYGHKLRAAAIALGSLAA